MARFFCNNSHTSKIVSIILCFLFLVSEGRAQTQNLNMEKWVFKLGFALNRSFVIDKNFSLINYNGNGPGFNSTINFKSKNVEQELSFSYSSYQLKNKYQNKLDESYINGNYTSLFCLTNRENKGFKLLAGPNLSVMHNTRKYEGFLNNNNTFDFASSLGASIEFGCGINKFMKGITLKNRFAMPFFSFVEQPVYGSEGFLFYSNNEEPVAKNMNAFVGPGKYFRVTNTISIDKVLAQHHKIILAYLVDYYKISTIREVKRNNNSLVLSYGFIL